MSLTLFSTDGCHLCEQAWALLAQTGLQSQTQISDIIDNEQWLAAYSVRIPVLRRPDGAELDWPFSAADILEFNRVI
ncbi:glutaredoxin family protein [Oceanisphaera pacifica]|uniref:Glutaredoxin family protein n=1 Tax=Oceanisphaera pacifica TaxID=2818389 RepID=A0ABS3NG26_9GAMM|nr:glutaredoxin family protein [Oceanisphaera pacifica]MBO1519475.1 glutaredoxin family protein [Oceanisphaera pacifica]